MNFRIMALGAAIVIVLGLVAAYAAISFGLVPANSDARPSGLERWAARTSLNATIHREMNPSPNPLPVTDANLNAGLKLYASNCMACHGAADGKASNIAHGLYQPAPQLADRGVEEDPDGEIYWKVQHGIRFTGMPSFGKTLTDTQLWQLVMFLKQMDKLPPTVAAAWKKEPTQASK
jgi:thiosulfate dehydrogenase